MLKKILSLCVFGAALSFAEMADPSLYTSGAAEPATPMMNINFVENDEPMFAVSIHPIDMIYDAIYTVPSVRLSIEGNINSNMSLMTRPTVMWGEFTRGSSRNRIRRDIDVLLFGISEGLRFYFSKGHRGWFMAGHFLYDRINLDYDFKYHPEENTSFKGNGFGFAFYGGHKHRSGHFTSSFEIGLSYTRYSIKQSARDDLDRVSEVNAELDVNYSIGYAF